MVDRFIGTALFLFVVLIAAALLVMLPVTLAAEAQCLERGYPRAAVTWNFRRYCMNLDGSVTVKVDSLP